MRVPRVYESKSDGYIWQNNFQIIPKTERRGMQVPRVYGSASDVYTWQNNYLNNFYPQLRGGCEFHAYKGVRQTSIVRKIII